MRTWKIVALLALCTALALVVGLKLREGRGAIDADDGAAEAEEVSCACEVDAPEGWAEVVAARDEDVPEVPPKAGQPAVVAFIGEDTDASREVTDLLADLEERIGDGAGVAIVDADVHRDQALQWRLRMVPTLIFLDAEGDEVARHEGTVQADTLLAALREAGAEGFIEYPLNKVIY